MSPFSDTICETLIETKDGMVKTDLRVMLIILSSLVAMNAREASEHLASFDKKKLKYQNVFLLARTQTEIRSLDSHIIFSFG